jgi:selenocysteine lyase/cysteine desulfurase
VVCRLGDDPEALCTELIGQGFIVRVRSAGIRVAPHFYNNEGDIDRLLTALDQLRR